MTRGDFCLFSEYNSRFVNEEARFFCLRVMVGVIILYDHVHPVGAFSKTSGIEVTSLFLLLFNFGILLFITYMSTNTFIYVCIYIRHPRLLPAMENHSCLQMSQRHNLYHMTITQFIEHIP